jgi:hypothetical protein
MDPDLLHRLDLQLATAQKEIRQLLSGHILWNL